MVLQHMRNFGVAKDHNFIIVKHISRIKFPEDSSVSLANALGHVGEGIYVVDPLKSDFTGIHLIRCHTSTCQTHTRTTYPRSKPTSRCFSNSRFLSVPLRHQSYLCASHRKQRVPRNKQKVLQKRTMGIERPRNEEKNRNGGIERRVDRRILRHFESTLLSSMLSLVLRAQALSALPIQGK